MSRREWRLAGGLVIACMCISACAGSGSGAEGVGDAYRSDASQWLDFSGASESFAMFAMATSLLGLAVIHRLRGHWTRWPLAAVVCVVSLLSVTWPSQFVLGTDDHMLTAVMLWLASAVWLSSARRGELRQLVASAAAIAFLALVSPGVMLALLAAQFVLLVWWGRYERSRAAALAAMTSAIPFAIFAGVRVWQVAVGDQWPVASLLGKAVHNEAAFRDYALVWTWAYELPSKVAGGFMPAILELRVTPGTDAAALPRSFDFFLITSASPWLLVGGCLVMGVLLGFLAGARPDVTLMAVMGVTLSIAPLIAFGFFQWEMRAVDFDRIAVPLLTLAAIAALVLPATIPHRRVRARRETLVDVTARWTSPVLPVHENGF